MTGLAYRQKSRLTDELSLKSLKFCISVRPLGSEVELDLRFGSGRTDGNDVAILVEELEDIGLLESGLLRLVVVDDLDNLRADNLSRWGLP